ncbi:BRO-N domain-containing protein [Paenibacillus elgii]|uniref:BRO-N domain-containing protein n=1 Tax=Paenibacillus elgii TaxID=189691 RepID=UPI00203AF854|nr:BRO family protein [Paenibacillus elgii]MCM3274305.1 hypothetical protein [Paenibacillus elgii]
MLKIFNHEVFGQMRTLAKNDEILFNLFDAGMATGYTTLSKGKNYLYKKRVSNIAKTLGIKGLDAVSNFELVDVTTEIDFENTYITEDSLYDLILESKAKHAREFRKWVTKVVLPEIRENGMYISEDATVEQKTYNYEMLDVTFSKIAAEFFKDEFESCMKFHTENKTRLSYERKHESRRSDKKMTHPESKIKIMNRILKVAHERALTYAKANKWALNSLINDAILDINMEIKAIKHNQTRGKLSYANCKAKVVNKIKTVY